MTVRGWSQRVRALAVLAWAVGCALPAARTSAQELCGGASYPFPYTDVASVGAAFCPGILEAYVTGVSKGTTPTTFSPNADVPRVQMTTFLQRALDQGLTRSNRRAALDQWWTPHPGAMQTIEAAGDGGAVAYCAADGEYIWVSIGGGGDMLVQVQASTGYLLSTWYDVEFALGIRVAAGKVYVAGSSAPGNLYMIDPTNTASYYPTSITIGNYPYAVAFDGGNLWTANRGPPGSVSIVGSELSYVVTVSTGFNEPYGILYDGAHIWVTDTGAGTLLKLDNDADILQTVKVGSEPAFPVFDGTNIWVPNYADNSVSVVQASTGNVVATITADASNQLNGPNGASFDGERIMIANYLGNSVTVFKAADLSFIANVSTGTATNPIVACSDGINFWIPLSNTPNLLRF